MERSPKRLPGRPRGFDRDAVLDRALELFWARGYEGTSVADLTEAMGITPPSLYAAFGSKAELYGAALERYQQRYGSCTREALEQEPTAKAAVARILGHAAREFASREHPAGCMLSLGAVACAPEHKLVAEAVAAMRASMISALKQRLDRAVAEGELPEDADTAGLARFVGALLQGMSVQARDGADEAALQAIVDTALAAWPAAKPGDTRPS